MRDRWQNARKSQIDQPNYRRLNGGRTESYQGGIRACADFHSRFWRRLSPISCPSISWHWLALPNISLTHWLAGPLFSYGKELETRFLLALCQIRHQIGRNQPWRHSCLTILNVLCVICSRSSIIRDKYVLSHQVCTNKVITYPVSYTARAFLCDKVPSLSTYVERKNNKNYSV
jgi:hypothetical protein